MTATAPADRAQLRRFLDAEARRLGFSGVGVTGPDAIDHAAVDLAGFLAAGHHATMTWMAETAARRARPRALWDEVRSVIVLAFDYGPTSDPLEGRGDRTRGEISVYARNRDYHDVIKGRLKELADRLAGEARRRGLGSRAKVFVDTAPVMEKPLAAAAGLAWQGKNTLAVSRTIGGWFFLGVIYTTLELDADAPAADHCGSCRRCLDVCPTDAFPAPHRLDARRCLSYLTIEHDGPIPTEFRAAMGDRIYGCDDCLAVCPWNKFAAVAREAKLVARPDLVRPALADLVGLDDAGFRAHFAGSPIKRIGRARFVRNVLIAIGNSGAAELAATISPRLGDQSAMVRGAAVWAAGRLMSGSALAAAFRGKGAAERDPAVAAEWRALGFTPPAEA
ncbi:tRNA epoxyqueuosine(34) reductase QueG [Siculibacillus lacustris]|uniref:Epoxyqueuosine reductase n=1 Tax=Siculibacillus lacustris TaxID=1549641 RepID=A0A4Q9VVX7_9HYPH|nr:tRNA epoxyqueuosine(34) reductase QueG [Siculibacillus lacustris]TBW40436.1 tRNA epoxyqueuosine(34) reductase QueG [Siculibacillus lacustris]